MCSHYWYLFYYWLIDINHISFQKFKKISLNLLFYIRGEANPIWVVLVEIQCVHGQAQSDFHYKMLDIDRKEKSRCYFHVWVCFRQEGEKFGFDRKLLVIQHFFSSKAQKLVLSSSEVMGRPELIDV